MRRKEKGRKKRKKKRRRWPRRSCPSLSSGRHGSSGGDSHICVHGSQDASGFAPTSPTLQYVPSLFRWHLLGVTELVSTVQNHGQCGSCLALSVQAALEATSVSVCAIADNWNDCAVVFVCCCLCLVVLPSGQFGTKKKRNNIKLICAVLVASISVSSRWSVLSRDSRLCVRDCRYLYDYTAGVNWGVVVNAVKSQGHRESWSPPVGADFGWIPRGPLCSGEHELHVVHRHVRLLWLRWLLD